MLDSRANHWLSRVPRNGPWLVTLLLAALISVELARIAIALLGGSPAASLRTLPGPLAATAAHAPIDVQSIAAAHLFGIAAGAAGGQDAANAPPTTANLLLNGTIATQNPKHGVAIISDSGPSKVYSVGDRIGGAALYAVYLDRVVLDRDGSLETLRLPKILPAVQPPAIVPGYGIANGGTAATLNHLRRMVLKDPGILNTVLRAVPSYDAQAHRMRGFRIYPGINRRAFNVLGLRPGDLVTAIDGTPLDDPQHSQEIFNTIQSADQATVTIDRNGQTLDLTLNVAEVTAEADKDLAVAPVAPLPPGAPRRRIQNFNASE